MKKIDETDLKILKLLQEDCTITVDQIAEDLDYSKNAIWRRIRQLDDFRVIRKRVALVDANVLGLGATAIVLIRTADHSGAWMARFKAAIRQLPNIQSAYRLTGDLDYMLRVRVRDIADYDRFYQQLVDLVHLSDVSASFVMEEILETTALPLSEVEPPVNHAGADDPI